MGPLHWSWNIVTLCLIITSAAAQNTGTYTIVGARALRPNSDYKVSISLFDTTAVTDIVVGIEGTQNGAGAFDYFQNVVIEPDSTKTLTFSIGDLGPGSYNLTARGTNGLEFFNTTKLNYKPINANQVFIQTDKKNYKAGQTIHFHVIILDSQLKPSNTESVEIFITDPKKNRVGRWNPVETSHGVFASKLPISKNPIFGKWRITAVVSGKRTTKSIRVFENLQPIFAVSIDLPPYLTFNASEMVASVRAEYLHGAPVYGKVTVTAKPLPGQSEPEDIPFIGGIVLESNKEVHRSGHGLIRRGTIFGKADFHFNLFKELRLTHNDEVNEYQVKIVAKVFDVQTNLEKTTEAVLTLYKHNYKLSLIKRFPYFKPGMRNTAFVKLSHQDGTPVQNEKEPVIVRYSFGRRRNQNDITTQYSLSRDGITEVNFDVPANAFIMWVEAEYRNVIETFPPTYYCKSPSNSFIKTVLKTDLPKVNQQVDIEVYSTIPLRSYNYEVIARGDLITSGRVQANGQRNHTFGFQVTQAMTPLAKVVVYHLRKDGEVVADALNFFVEGILQNFVEVQVPNVVGPGRNVGITVKTKPNSYVSILGVDQRAATDNILTKENVVVKYVDYVPKQIVEVPGKTFWWNLASTASQVFDYSSVVILTNAYGGYRMSPNSDGIGSEQGAQGNKISSDVWLFNSITAGSDGTARFVEKAPDSISSWVITGFAIDPVHGLGIIEQPIKLQVFRPLFIQLNVPSSVIRGEAVTIRVTVFNYMKQTINTEVTFENIQDLELATPVRNKRTVRVLAQSSNQVSFLIQPLRVGNVDLHFTANANAVSDTITSKLLIKAEGLPSYQNQAYLLDLRSGLPFQKVIRVAIPQNAVSDSQSIELSAITHVMGPSINNLQSLIRKPFGNGESNMLLFVPNIFAIELSNANQLSTDLRARALSFMETGYQTELTYQRKDGSFSPFGKQDAVGSMWLTAFVARFFKQAQRHMNAIEDRIINKALDWIIEKQAADGSFSEVTDAALTSPEGRSAERVPLTAYVLLAFLEDKRLQPLYELSVKMAVEFLTRNLLRSKNFLYSLAMNTYILHLTDSSDDGLKQASFRYLQAKANKTDEGFLFWVNDEETGGSLSLNIEITAYCLLTYLERGLLADALSIARWLVAQRNSNGGFVSTQDTIIGLFALAKYAEKMSESNTNINVEFKHAGGGGTFSLTSENAMVLQRFKLPPETTEVFISAAGSGSAIIQLSTTYNLKETAWIESERRSFYSDVLVMNSSTQYRVDLEICPRETRDKKQYYGTKSSMVVMEINLPSGYMANQDIRGQIDQIRKIERKQNGTAIDIYFNELPVVKRHCFYVTAYRVYEVVDHREAYIVTYDYSSNSPFARDFYQIAKGDPCKNCRSMDCFKKCNVAQGLRSERVQWKISGGLQLSKPTGFCLLLSCLTSALLLM